MNHKKALGFLFLGLIFLMAGCAGMQPVRQLASPTTPAQWDPGRYEPKTENFVIILDASSSMSEKFQGQEKFVIASNIVKRFNYTLPEFDFNGALRSFGHSPQLTDELTTLFYEPQPWDRSGFDAAASKVTPAGGTTPMALALSATDADLDPLQGNIAAIIVSDGKDLAMKPVPPAEALKSKYGERLCFYPVLVGDDRQGRQLMEALAAAGQCGFMMDADALITEEGMRRFIEQVFLQPVMAPVASASPDSDGDGVIDSLDKCPGTPSGVQVNADGCPLDTDGDGVYDYLDKCPGTPPGVSVDRSGCPLDSDKDGVYDHRDACPGTPQGADVDERGCWVLANVFFDFNQWELKPAGYSVLDKVVGIMVQNPDLKAEVEGHTDNVGSERYNLKLSEKRADAVVSYLIQKGVSPERLTAKGYGFSKPIASNDTEAGRAKNRRVELTPIQ